MGGRERRKIRKEMKVEALEGWGRVGGAAVGGLHSMAVDLHNRWLTQHSGAAQERAYWSTRLSAHCTEVSVRRSRTEATELCRLRGLGLCRCVAGWSFLSLPEAPLLWSIPAALSFPSSASRAPLVAPLSSVVAAPLAPLTRASLASDQRHCPAGCGQWLWLTRHGDFVLAQFRGAHQTQVQPCQTLPCDSEVTHSQDSRTTRTACTAEGRGRGVDTAVSRYQYRTNERTGKVAK